MLSLTGSIWPKPGRIISIKGLQQARKIQGVEHIFMRYSRGDVISPYVDCTKRVCFIITSGADEAQAGLALEKAKQTIKIETE